jgi:ferredoxin
VATDVLPQQEVATAERLCGAARLWAFPAQATLAPDGGGLYNVPVLLRKRGGQRAVAIIQGIVFMPKVTFVNEKKELEVVAGSNLRSAALEAGIEIYKGADKVLNCRGFGLCGTCKVFVKKGMDNLSPKTLREKFNLNFHPFTMLAALGHEDEIRLSCQVKVNGDCTIETKPAFNWSGENFWQKPYPNK